MLIFAFDKKVKKLLISKNRGIISKNYFKFSTWGY